MLLQILPHSISPMFFCKKCLQMLYHLCIYVFLQVFICCIGFEMIYNRQNKVEIEIKVLEHDKNKGVRKEEKMSPRKD